MERNTYEELVTKFTPGDLKDRLNTLNGRIAQMLMMDDIQSVIQEKQDIEFILGENEQTK
jgi:hypothetical protein